MLYDLKRFFSLQIRAKLACVFCLSFYLGGCATVIQGDTAALDCDGRFTRCAPEIKPAPRIQVVENTSPQPLEETAEPLNAFMITPPEIAPILFEFDSATVLGIDFQEAVGFLLENPDVMVVLHGYADSLGGDDYNKRLSYQRAAHISKRLVAAGVSRTQISVEAHGEQDLKVPEMSETQFVSKEALIAMYKENRRVRFEFNIPNAVAQRN